MVYMLSSLTTSSGFSFLFCEFPLYIKNINIKYNLYIFSSLTCLSQINPYTIDLKKKSQENRGKPFPSPHFHATQHLFDNYFLLYFLSALCKKNLNVFGSF